jgi:predicted nucleic acid-binding protein
VIGGYFDTEYRKPTREWWEQLTAGRCHALLCTLTLEELARAPEEVRKLVERLPPTLRTVLTVTNQARKLAERYIEAGVLSGGARADAIHVAVATLAHAKAIVSWNFKHLVNLRRVEGFNGVNLLAGYQSIDIRTPNEVLEP